MTYLKNLRQQEKSWQNNLIVNVYLKILVILIEKMFETYCISYNIVLFLILSC